MVELDRVETVTFDSYTTLVDVDAAAEVLADRVETIENPEAVSRLWRSRNMMYSVIANDIDAYHPFYKLQGLSLRYALEAHGHSVPEEIRDDIRQTVYKDQLSVFEDVHEGMTRIHEMGYDQYIISNGDPKMLAHLIETADINELIEDTISADEIQTFKPDSKIYRHGAARTGTPIDHILHVSGGTMRDVWGAMHAGMQTAWIDRPEKFHPREYLSQEPDLTVEDFQDLADRLETIN
jgi:2-haloacid dehalogenase